jgi:hypothetical protein
METINHEYYVSLEVAELLEKAGFDWEVEYVYNFGKLIRSVAYPILENELAAPTLEVAQRWLREVKDYDVFVVVDDSMEYAACIFHNKEDEDDYYECYKTYEKAQESGIKKALELILEKGE